MCLNNHQSVNAELSALEFWWTIHQSYVIWFWRLCVYLKRNSSQITTCDYFQQLTPNTGFVSVWWSLCDGYLKLHLRFEKSFITHFLSGRGRVCQNDCWLKISTCSFLRSSVRRETAWNWFSILDTYTKTWFCKGLRFTVLSISYRSDIDSLS